MRVAVDARTVYSPTRRGTGKNLIDLYRRIARLHPEWEIVMFRRADAAPDEPFADLPNVSSRIVEMRGDRWNLWEQARLPWAARRAGAAVLHAPANTAPRVPMVPLVVTIHDLIPLEMDGGGGPATRQWTANVSRAARVARKILTPSQYTRGRLVERFGIGADKVVVNHWAPDSRCRAVTAAGLLNEVRQRYGLRPDQPYLFGFGAIDPRKNTARLIEAWAGLPVAVRSDVALLLVGLQEPALSEHRRRARQLAPEGGWSLMPFASEEDLPALMSGATALCYPSLSEGFGLPVLDAFACGTPVITSRTTSLPEVAGDAALLVDPLDVLAIGCAMQRLATSVALRQELRDRGSRRLEAFSWDRCAETAARVLAEAA
jgi:glycosyltransferase involved in cell wall biosynthesis